MRKPVVLCTQAMHEAGRAMLEPVADLRVPAQADPALLDAMLADSDYLVVRNHLRPGFLDQTHRLRAIVRHGTGLDMIPMDSATRQGIPVANVPGANAQAVAEHVVGCFFALARRFTAMDASLRRTSWEDARRIASHSVELAGKTVGIIGVGDIGSRIASICASALRMRVLGYHPRRKVFPAGIEGVSLDELLTTSDFVTLNCPLTDETRGILDANRIGQLKPTAFVVNAARGGLVDELALADALRTRAVAGAAVDVFSSQPLAASHPFRNLENILLTPHSAALTRESSVAMSTGTARQLLRLMRGERPDHLVNPEVWDGWLRKHGSSAQEKTS
jgi:D-3-phosphoglycerate dehydrogenase